MQCNDDDGSGVVMNVEVIKQKGLSHGSRYQSIIADALDLGSTGQPLCFVEDSVECNGSS
jgi:hypothetical protein